MSTPQDGTPKESRRSARRAKQTPLATENGILISSNAEEASPSKVATSLNVNNGRHTLKDGEGKPNNRRKSHGPNKQKDDLVGEERAVSVQKAGRGDASQAAKTKVTPVRQAYAGPTFQNSPAPSALPIPSFYSKSVPNVSTMKPPEEANDSGDVENHKTESPKLLQTITTNEDRSKREPTPLDFLFEAAKKAQQTTRMESPSTRSPNMSATEDSPYSRSPAPRDGDAMFPFELEGGRGSPNAIGASFATPYKDRIDELRTISPSATTGIEIGETERKAKTEALKKLLMHSQIPRSASASPRVPDPNNPFNARPLPPRNPSQSSPQGRPHSGPSTPAPGLQNAVGPPQYFGTGSVSHQNYGLAMPRPPSSHLRHAYQPSAESSPVELSSIRTGSPPLISTARKQTLRNHTPNVSSEHMQPRYDLRGKAPEHKSKPSAQEMEDDLRRILKLDISS